MYTFAYTNDTAECTCIHQQVMSTKKVYMLYGERLVPFNKRVPESRKQEIELEWALLMKKYEKASFVEVSVGKKEVEQVSPKVIKEPTRISDKLFGTTKIQIGNYACLIDLNGTTCYWGDTLLTFLVFDDEAHAKEYLTKHKP